MWAYDAFVVGCVVYQCGFSNSGTVDMFGFFKLINVKYRVALNFSGSSILRMGDFLCFAGTNFCDWEKLVFLSGN